MAGLLGGKNPTCDAMNYHKKNWVNLNLRDDKKDKKRGHQSTNLKYRKYDSVLKAMSEWVSIFQKKHYINHIKSSKKQFL